MKVQVFRVWGKHFMSRKNLLQFPITIYVTNKLIFVFQIKKMLKVGILGGGQLGRMLLQAAANYPVQTHVLENDAHCPAAHLCHHFTLGDIRSYTDVYNFGKQLNAVTIEIENVNEEALAQLEKEGVCMYPTPAALRIIKNKITQKKYYQQLQIPSAPFMVTQNLQELLRQEQFLPAVHKVALGGYDGKGTQVLTSKEQLQQGFDEPSVLEKKILIDKEIAQIVAVATNGNIVCYPPVEMVFDPNLNLLSYQISCTTITPQQANTVKTLAIEVVQSLKSPGIFAVEFFIANNGEVYVNETAPRVHNSGHHTIEANFCSQFDMLWRIILNYPLGNTAAIVPAALVNLLGADSYQGIVHYEGLSDILQIENVFVHIYGKAQTKPGRKMGHVTILGDSKEELIQKADAIMKTMKVKSIPLL
jgi:5-(carboxyamino)imidazole ribonucleotide synthase